MKNAFLLLACCLMSCRQQVVKKTDPASVTETPEARDTTAHHISKKYPVGDINNDKKADTATVSYDFNFDTQEVVCPTPDCPIKITFGPNIPGIDIDLSLGVFVRMAPDLNNDKADDILLFSRTYEGYWNNIFIYSFSNGKWTELACTKCFFSDDADAENRIVKEKGKYYLVGDSWDDAKGGVVKRSVMVEIKREK
ncbi:MAG TPA: hypothetical protein VK476_04800 [Flavobacterium sp.]|nr:hypothetical protein [Flavobacterium sp.]